MARKRTICIRDRDVAQLASLLSRLLDEHGWKDAELARRAMVTAERLHAEHPTRGYDKFYSGAAGKVENRLHRILLGRIRSDRAEHRGLAEDVAWDAMAKEVYADEVEVYARTLGVHPPWLACAGRSPDPIRWDPEDPDDRPEHLDYLLRVYEKMAAGMYIFSLSPPPELVPEEFMHAYHEAVFRGGSACAHRTPIYKFSTLGNSRRDWLQKPAHLRVSTITYATTLQALKDLANGDGVYSEIGKDLRRWCLEFMRGMCQDAGKGVEIVAAQGGRRGLPPPHLNNFHSLIVCLDVMSLERGLDWKVKYWVGRCEKTITNWQEARAFVSVGKYNTPDKTDKLLSRLAADVK